MLHIDFTFSGNELLRVGASTEKYLLPLFVVNLGTKIKDRNLIIIIMKYNIYIAPYSQVLYGAVHCYYNY